jgi:hypothetical protein
VLEQIGDDAPPALAVAAPCHLRGQRVGYPLGVALGPLDLAEYVAVAPRLRVALTERNPDLP